MRIAISLQGRELFGVEISRHSHQQANDPEPQQPKGETPGPVTEYRGSADTQIGFTSSKPRPLSSDGRRE